MHIDGFSGSLTKAASPAPVEKVLSRNDVVQHEVDSERTRRAAEAREPRRVGQRDRIVDNDGGDVDVDGDDNDDA